MIVNDITKLTGILNGTANYILSEMEEAEKGFEEVLIDAQTKGYAEANPSFDIDGILIKERNFPSESKLMYKASSGAIEYINIFEVSNINSTLKNLKEKNFWVYGFDGRGEKNFTDIKWQGNNILLFGSEGSGMHEHTSKYADFLVKIDINEKVESLNISNSAAIVFHHLKKLKY